MKMMEFKIRDVFKINTTIGIDAGTLKLYKKQSKNTFEFVGRTETNYGVQGYTKKLQVEPNPENSISVSQVGTIIAQFRQEPYYASQNMFSLIPKNKFNNEIALYLVTSLNKYLKKYQGGYNSYPTKTKLNQDSFYLPTSDGINPDWDYMENYIKDMQDKYKEKIKKQNDQWIKDACQIVGLDAEEILNPKEKDKTVVKTPELRYETGEFLLEKLFPDYTRGQRLVTVNRLSGNLPLITAGKENMGIAQYIKQSKNNVLYEGYNITIDMFGNSFFRNYPYQADDNIISINLDKYSKEIALYIVSALSYLRNIYNYNGQFRINSLKNTKIILPIDKEGDPDFSMMEKIIHTHTLKSLLKINKYLMKES